MNFTISNLRANHLSLSPLFTMQRLKGDKLSFSKMFSPVFFNNKFLQISRSKFEHSLNTVVRINKDNITGQTPRYYSIAENKNITFTDCYFVSLTNQNDAAAVYIQAGGSVTFFQCDFTKCYSSSKCGAFMISAVYVLLDNVCIFNCRSFESYTCGYAETSEQFVMKESIVCKCTGAAPSTYTTLKVVGTSTLTYSNFTRNQVQLFAAYHFSSAKSDPSRISSTAHYNNTASTITGLEGVTNRRYREVFFAFNQKHSIALLEVNNIDISESQTNVFTGVIAQHNDGPFIHCMYVDIKMLKVTNSNIDTPIPDGLNDTYNTSFDQTTALPTGQLKYYGICIPLNLDTIEEKSPTMIKVMKLSYGIFFTIVGICVIIIIVTEVRNCKLKKKQS